MADGAASDLARLTGELLSINSANPATCPSGAGERAVAEFCCSWLIKRGVTADLVFSPELPGRPGVFAEVGSSHAPALLLQGHLDTYLWVEPRVEASLLYGAGASDMKGGLAAILSALVTVRPGTHLQALLVPDEEHRSLGARTMLPGIEWNTAIVVEDSGLNVGVSQWGSVSSFLSATDALKWLKFSPPELRKSVRLGVDREHPEVVGVRIPVPPGVSPDAAADSFPLGGVTVRGSLATDPASPLVRTLIDAGRAAGIDPAVVQVPRWTEAGMLAAYGKPCVVFGPGGGGAHTPFEWADLDSITTAARVLTATAEALSGEVQHAGSDSMG